MKDIMMRIIGTQFGEDREEEQMEFITEGKLYEKGEAMYLLYDETEISGMPGCKTRLKLKYRFDYGIHFVFNHRALIVNAAVTRYTIFGGIGIQF